ncbi:MAG: four helix bundle protein [Patescibacteria group bacterium]|jgi:four helix bundle protein
MGELQNNHFNLEERTAQFGIAIIRFSKTLSQDAVSRPLINQLVRSGTSVGANYMEANGASSRKDFQNKIYICKKEVQETKHWLRMIAECCPSCRERARILWAEAQELTLIFGKIVSTLNSKKRDEQIL